MSSISRVVIKWIKEGTHGTYFSLSPKTISKHLQIYGWFT